MSKYLDNFMDQFGQIKAKTVKSWSDELKDAQRKDRVLKELEDLKDQFGQIKAKTVKSWTDELKDAQRKDRVLKELEDLKRHKAIAKEVEDLLKR